jgi:ribulose-phosphate 3-epimerase
LNDERADGLDIKIAPAIMDADLGHLAEAVAELEEAGADLLHVDVMDGHYVPQSVGCLRIVATLRRYATIPVDVHLMVTNPDEAVPRFLDAGAQIVLFHPEVSKDAADLISRIQKAGARAGVAFKPHMNADCVKEIARMMDCVMAMTVNPGYSGQKFMEEGCRKIPELRRMCRPDVDVYVDGGIDLMTAPIAVKCGANVLAAASAVFKADVPPGEAVKRLKQAALNAVSS